MNPEYPLFQLLIQKEDNAPQATIDLVIESIGLPNHFLYHTEPSEVESKLPIRMSWLDCTVTRNCFAAPFVHNLYV